MDETAGGVDRLSDSPRLLPGESLGATVETETGTGRPEVREYDLGLHLENGGVVELQAPRHCHERERGG